MQRTKRIKSKVLKKLKSEFDQIGVPCHGIILLFPFLDEPAAG